MIKIVFLFCSSVIYGQMLHHQSINSQGNSIKLNTGLVVNQTIGQQSSAVTTKSSVVVQQGFQQSFWSTLIERSTSSNSLKFVVYPNPFNEEFTIMFSPSEQKEVVVDIFRLYQLYKGKSMKTGTWGIKGEVSHKSVTLELSLTRQIGMLRAVPIKTVNKSETLITVAPGKIHKHSALAKLQVEIGEDLSEEEVLMALPTGGIKIVRKK
jgi:hypothetical protein